MKNTLGILRKLNAEKVIIDLYLKHIKFPSYIDGYKPYSEIWFPHPPVLIPLFVNYETPGLYGYFLHHFIDKEIPIVNYSLETNYMVEEARNAEQFFTGIILSDLELGDGLEDEMFSFVKEINYPDVDLLENLDYESYSKDYSIVPTYKGKLPFLYCEKIEDYNGDFLSTSVFFGRGEKLLNLKALNKSCSYELVDNSILDGVNDIPLWLNSNTDKKDLFEFYVDRTELDKAWLTLNSSSWYLKDIAEGLQKLKLKTENELFHLIADNWIDGWENSEGYDSHIL